MRVIEYLMWCKANDMTLRGMNYLACLAVYLVCHLSADSFGSDGYKHSMELTRINFYIAKLYHIHSKSRLYNI
jgi:hypothetical protein